MLGVTMEDRIKKLEQECCYLRKEIETLKKQQPVEIHTHYTTIVKTIQSDELPFFDFDDQID